MDSKEQSEKENREWQYQRENRRKFLWENIHVRLLTDQEMEEARRFGKFLNTSEPWNDDDREKKWWEVLQIQQDFKIKVLEDKIKLLEGGA